MIDRFYAKHLTAEMNVELIQSNRSVGLANANAEIKKRVLADTNTEKINQTSSKTTKSSVKKSATNAKRSAIAKKKS